MGLFRRKKTIRYEYTTPAGTSYALYEDMLSQPHMMIAGATGSGKSVAINGMIAESLLSAPSAKKFILIDPKRVELVDYKFLPHTIAYASEPGDMVSALYKAMEITEERYKEMSKRHEKKYSGGDLYVIIDEFADLMTTNKRQVQPIIQRLAQIGRAAKVHIILATQCPLRDVIPTSIKVNFDSRLALRTRSSQDSRNILEQKGCELLPRYGQGYYMKPGELTLYNIPMVEDSEIQRLVRWWSDPKNIRRI